MQDMDLYVCEINTMFGTICIPQFWHYLYLILLRGMNMLDMSSLEHHCVYSTVSTCVATLSPPTAETLT